MMAALLATCEATLTSVHGRHCRGTGAISYSLKGGLACLHFADGVQGDGPARSLTAASAASFNRCCSFDARLESLLLGDPSKILFQQVSIPTRHHPVRLDVRRTLVLDGLSAMDVVNFGRRLEG
jgi:hypothetical protein